MGKNRGKEKRVYNNCEYCDDCLYLCEGDFMCDRYGTFAIVKEDWTPTEYYNNCKKCKSYKGD